MLPPSGRKNYTKTGPLRFEEFADCQTWWNNRKENQQAWKMSASELIKYSLNGDLVSVNLDVKNPNSSNEIVHVPPGQLVQSLLSKEQRIAELVTSISKLLQEKEN
jgi:type I restriction enzyme M protein